MLDTEVMKKKPQQGKKFIYRYFDKEGSYIGQTKKSLKARAGKDGRLYCINNNKWSQAILEKGFDHFNVEILCECLETDADKEEKKYIKQFDSRNSGYNTTPGGNWYNPNWDYTENDSDTMIINIKEAISNLTDGEVKYTYYFYSKMFNLTFINNPTKDDLYNLYKELNNIYISCTYYAFEGEYEDRTCTALAYISDYLEHLSINKEYIENIYKHIKFEEDMYNEFYPARDKLWNNGLSQEANKILDEIEYKIHQKYENINLLNTDIELFLKNISSNEIINYFNNNVFKDLSCGDCLSLGIDLKFIF